MTSSCSTRSQGLSRWVMLAFVSCLAKRSTAFSIQPTARHTSSLQRRLIYYNGDITTCCSLSSSSSDTAYSPDDFIEMQTNTSNMTKSGNDDDSQTTYLQHQQAVFDEMSNVFASDDATPPHVVPVMKHLAHSILKRNENASTTIRLMDVGCGTGALFPFYLEAATALNIEITGVDLSPKMAALARQRAEKLLKSCSLDNSITVLDSDFVAFMETNEEYRNAYDVVVANACFGNFFDTDATLAAMASCLKVGGMLFITHPLGADFVQKLHEEDASTVPHLLPTRDELIAKTTLPLQVVEWQQEDADGNSIYLAGAMKLPYQPLPQLLRFRGTVDSGYGRGGKKLGFPTANLPESLFCNALENISTGVYFGWAVVEGRNGIYKAAVNVGYSPTFQGKENAEKIIEAHLIPDKPIDDFYGESMRLALCGFLRPEQKFDSFPNLMAAITNDVSNAKEALTIEPFASLREDSFLMNANKEWIGASGGDATASWEFQDLSAAMDQS